MKKFFLKAIYFLTGYLAILNQHILPIIKMVEVIKKLVQSGVLQTATQLSQTKLDDKIVIALAKALPILQTSLLEFKDFESCFVSQNQQRTILCILKKLSQKADKPLYSIVLKAIAKAIIQSENSEMPIKNLNKKIEDAYFLIK